jgi:hypothetical protein
LPCGGSGASPSRSPSPHAGLPLHPPTQTYTRTHTHTHRHTHTHTHLQVSLSSGRVSYRTLPHWRLLRIVSSLLSPSDVAPSSAWCQLGQRAACCTIGAWDLLWPSIGSRSVRGARWPHPQGIRIHRKYTESPRTLLLGLRTGDGGCAAAAWEGGDGLCGALRFAHCRRAKRRG